MGFEPNSVGVDQADNRNRYLEQPRGQTGDTVERFLGRCIEYGIAFQSRETVDFVVG